MLFTKDRPKTHQRQTKLGTEEAYRLWEKTRIRYTVINELNLIGNFAHDIDFQLILKSLNETFQKQVQILENEMKRYSIKSPEPNKRDIEAIGNREVLEDKYASRIIFNSLKLIVDKCFLTLRDSILNDDVRELLYKITKEDVNLYHKYIDFMLTKNWLEEAPLYKSLKNSDKRVTTNEIWHLWKLLDNRYLSKQETKYFITNVIDKDFQLLLSRGIDLLEKQVKQLENILLFYGVNLPTEFSKNIPASESTEKFTDEYTFRLLFMSMINAVTLEGFAIEEILINPDVRKMVKGFVFEEMDVIDDVIKYGKIKGWAPLDPQFRNS